MESTRDDGPERGPLARAALNSIHWIRKFNTAMHYVAGAALLGILALTVADIGGRSLLRNPVPGTVEVTSLTLIIVVFLGLAHSEDLGDHITVDLLYVRLGRRLKMWLDYVADAISVVVLGFLALQLFKFAQRQMVSGAESPVLRWPVWPFVLIASLGALGYMASTAIKTVLRAMGESTEVVDPAEGEGGGVEI